MTTKATQLKKIGQDKRRFQRVEIELQGRYMLPSKVESACRVIEMSPGNVAVETTAKPDLGDRVVVYVEKLGRFDGRVQRVTESGFAMAVDCSATRRDKLADTLTWFANRNILKSEDDSRESERIVPLVRRTILTLADGQEALAQIIDLSRVGVGVETKLRPAIGATIMVGRAPANVVRHFARGIGCTFVKPFADAQLDEATIL